MGNYSTDSFPTNRWADSDALSNLSTAIASIDASIRHAFGFSVNALTAPFDIADDGSIVVQTSLAIGTSNAIIDVVDSIPASAGANEDQKIATVESIRAYLLAEVAETHTHDAYLNKDGTVELTANWDAGAYKITSAELSTDVISEEGSASGVTVDSCLIKDGQVASAVLAPDYLPLAAGSGSPLTGDLFLEAAGSYPAVRCTDTDLDSAWVELSTLGIKTSVGIGGTAYLAVHGAAGVTYTDNSSTEYDVWTEKDFDYTDYLLLTGGTIDGDLIIDYGPSLQVKVGAQEEIHDAVTGGSLGITFGAAAAATYLVGSATRPPYNAADLALFSDVIFPITFDTFIDKKERNAEYNIHGGLSLLDTGHDLGGGGSLAVTCGTGKIMLVINSGPDLIGDITITGTTVDRNTGAETGADTDTITIDGATSDESSTDASGNTKHSFDGAYISSKWFKGSINIESVDTDVDDMDTYQVSFEQINDSPTCEITTFDINALATNAAAWMYAYLYTLVVTGDKCDITRAATLDLPAAEVSADKFYRLRRGNLSLSLNGSSDGFWIDMFPGPLASAYWENINIKVWAEITPEV